MSQQSITTMHERPNTFTAVGEEFKPDALPSFPQGLPTVELETFSLSKLLGNNDEEQDRLFEVCKTKGFFYLNLEETDAAHLVSDSMKIGHLAEEVFKLPQKDKDERSFKNGTIFGYKPIGATKTDSKGTRDTAEFWNVAKDQILAPEPPESWPQLLLDARPLMHDYVTTAHKTGCAILSILGQKLGLDASVFPSKHRIERPAGDHIRLTRGPARKDAELPEIQTPGHTDFGSITILFNWLGGLQIWSNPSRGETGFRNILDPESTTDQWLWIMPKRGHAIVNLGDAAVKFTNGVFCSGRHRVVPAPGEQGKVPRYSVVYFVRPENDAVLKQFHSPMIPEPKGIEEEITANEWIIKQSVALGNKVD